MSTSVDGLVSGLSTSSMITSLMQVEAAPQTRLKVKVSTAQTAVSSYQSVNSKVAAMKTAAESLMSLGTWRSIKATSSSSSVTTTTSTNLSATSGSLTFDVTSLASKQSTTMPVGTYAYDTDGKLKTTPEPITQATQITVKKGTWDGNGNFTPVGDPVLVDISKDQSAAGIASAINSAGAGATAYVMKTSDTEGVLQINGTKPGAGNGFVIEGLDGEGLNGASPATTEPKSAAIKVNGGGGTAYEVKSDTNTFTGLMNGVTINVTKLETGVTVDVAQDVDAIADKLSAFVDASNAALTEIGTQTAYDAATKTGSPLTGDFSVRSMQQKILSAISGGLTYADPNSTKDAPLPDVKFGALAKMGIQLDKNNPGFLKFDKSAFVDAYTADPAAIKQAGMGFGENMQKMTKTMTANLRSVVEGRNSEIDSLNGQISNWDIRLAAKKLALQKQYSDLESSLGKLKNQSNWLAGQLG